MVAPKVFISYSHKDEEWKDRLQTQLAVLEMEELLSVWEDRQIEMGNDWYPEIEKALNSSDVAILLISANFLTSKFILGTEIPRLLERREKEGVRVIPLIIRPCPWQKVAWLSAMQGSSRDNVVLSGLNEHEQDVVLSKLAGKVHDLLNLARIDSSTTITSLSSMTISQVNFLSTSSDSMSPSTPKRNIDNVSISNIREERQKRLTRKLQALYKDYDYETRRSEKLRLQAEIDEVVDELEKLDDAD